MITALILTVIMMGAAKLLLRGDSGVDFSHVFGLVFVVNAIFYVALNIIEANNLGLVPVFAALLVSSLIILFTSNTMYEWGIKKSCIFAGVFVVSYILLDIGLLFLFGGP